MMCENAPFHPDKIYCLDCGEDPITTELAQKCREAYESHLHIISFPQAKEPGDDGGEKEEEEEVKDCFEQMTGDREEKDVDR
jgi:hypothetical protein